MSTKVIFDEDFSTFSSRLKWARKRSKLTQAQLAGMCSISQANYSKLEKTGQSSGKTAQLARVLNVSSVWLADGTGTFDNIEQINEDQFVEVKRVKLKISGGISGFSVDYIGDDGEPIMFRQSWLKEHRYNPEKLFAMKVKGRSMETGLHEGDVIVFNAADVEPRDGKVFAINYDGEPVIKRLTRDNDAWWLDSDNADKTRYPRKFCTSTTMLIGLVIHKQSEHI